jgi:glycerophosphoryl diester phosphodiesterase
MTRISRKTLSLAGITAATVASSLAASPAVAAPGEDFDLQAHRGGIGLTVESTLPAFAKALELGVSTLELDTQITEDGVAVVTHDRKVSDKKCADTAPTNAGDPEFPYVGKYVNTLTLAQIKTLDCGSLPQAGYPGQEVSPGERMPTLTQVFDLVKRYGADKVELNVETKVEAGAPSETAPREQFVQVVAGDVREAEMLGQVTIQSFDWGALMRMRAVEPALKLVALTNYDFLQVDKPGASPWLGGIDIDDFDDDPIAAIDSFGASAFSPAHGFPQNGKVTDPDYRPYVTRPMVRDAHRRGIEVIPWTVNDKPTMASMMDAGVDGLITDYPDRLRELMAERGMELPRSYDDPGADASLAPLDRAHAHNDYEHQRPLYDALSHGFTSVEADVWLVDGELLVAHDRDQVQPGRTLESLYLDPLEQQAARHGGTVFGDYDGVFQLLVDVKSEANPTYRAVHDELREHERIMTRFEDGQVEQDAVTAVISGNRDLPYMQSQDLRFAGYDGRMADLDSGLPASDLPLLSDNWTKQFTWQGVGPMPEAEHAKLHDIADRAHDAGYRLRFWATPDAAAPSREEVWKELLHADVDHINTDDLAGLETFLRTHDS